MTHPRNIARTIPAPRGAGIVAAFALLLMVLSALALPAGRVSAQEATPTPTTEIPKFGISVVGEDGIFFHRND